MSGSPTFDQKGGLKVTKLSQCIVEGDLFIIYSNLQLHNLFYFNSACLYFFQVSLNFNNNVEVSCNLLQHNKQEYVF